MKILTIIGGNARLAALIAGDEGLTSSFSKVVLFSTRKIGCENHHFGKKMFKTFSLDELNKAKFQDLVGSKTKDNVILFMGTPSSNSSYTDLIIVEKTLDLINYERVDGCFNTRNRVYILGSTVILTPNWLLNGVYKKIKTIEFLTYQIRAKFSRNISYVFLPPVGVSKSIAGKIFVTSEKDFVSQLGKIITAEGPNGICYVGNGIIRFLTRTLHAFKY